MRTYLIYAKCEDQNRYHAMDINEGIQVGNLIYATMLNEENAIKALDALRILNPTIEFEIRKTKITEKIA